jgi:DNA helicase IV
VGQGQTELVISDAKSTEHGEAAQGDLAAIARADVQEAPEGAAAIELAREQKHVTLLYEKLDELLAAARASLARTASASTVGTPGARSERDAFMRLYAQRVRTLHNVESRLCFGRLDLVPNEEAADPQVGEIRYIGRLGISDDQRRELLVDWRAPAAEPFYQATAAHPAGVLRRRQIAIKNRLVTSLQDEVLDLEGFERSGVAGEHVVVGEGALFAALDVARSSRMRDIVATIQADQDRVIRAPLDGVLVVQGGPGTGKTAVALHRTAFLLYANRDKISRTGVLLVGPSRVFLRYIDQVLPALGEADAVVMATPGELYPAIVATAHERPELAVLKGDLRMARLVGEAVRRRQRTIPTPRPLDVDGTVIQLRPEWVRDAREHARRTRQPHNEARASFVSEMLRRLVRALADARDVELDQESRPGLMAELYESIDVRRELNWCWAPITPERLLRDLFANGERLEEAANAARLTRDERVLLRRERGAEWTLSDVALLDEAAELLGADETAANTERARAAAERRLEVEYARQVQDTFGGADFGTAEDLAARYAATSDLGTVAERAGADRDWAFGHVVVDEAQELSPMMWRLLMRRCPSGSFTVVGDVNQTGSAAGARSWREMLEPHVRDRWRLSELTVNYRTPEQVMRLAADFLAASGSEIEAPTSARIGRENPLLLHVDGELASSTVVADRAREEWKRITEEGTVAFITPSSMHASASRTVREALGGVAVATDTDSLASTARVSVLTVDAAKGLEFDSVVVLEPASIVGESPQGRNDLYVALTRPTQRLCVLHSGPLPAGFESIDLTEKRGLHL